MCGGFFDFCKPYVHVRGACGDTRAGNQQVYMLFTPVIDEGWRYYIPVLNAPCSLLLREGSFDVLNHYSI